jgi:hypothetical protein
MLKNGGSGNTPSTSPSQGNNGGTGFYDPVMKEQEEVAAVQVLLEQMEYRHQQVLLEMVEQVQLLQ